MFRKIADFLGAICIATIAATASANTYPQRPVTVVVGYAPGTGPDTLARMLSEPLAQALGRPVVIENKPGAGGQIAASQVARSPADGHVLYLGDPGSLVFSPLTTKRLPYETTRDFVPISEVARVDFAWIVPSSQESKTLADFADSARKSSAKTLIGTIGVGSPSHVAAELLADLGNFGIEPIHFRAPGDLIAALGNGQVQGTFVSIPFASAQIKGGRVRALVQTGESRSTLLPDVPTVNEGGFRELTMPGWFILVAPRGTPAPVVARVHSALRVTLSDPAVISKLSQAGFVVVGSSPDTAKSLIENELQRWKKVVDKAGIEINP